MGNIYYLMGKSASGKDTLYKRLLQECPALRTVVTYTTRPVRIGETGGVEYYFTDDDQLEYIRQQGKVIEQRTYQTVFGPWTYATVDDGQINLEEASYLVIGTLESYREMKRYFGQNVVVPLYIQIDDGVRLIRAIERERQQEEPKYTELCRRFLADEEDFSKENLAECGITEAFSNQDIEICIKEIMSIMETR
ncbi:MAG: guanylate kinase [Lachnospiraceae bacterium]